MAIVKILTTPLTEKQVDFFTKYNNTCDQIFVSIGVSTQDLVLTKFGGGTASAAGIVMFKKGNAAAQDSVVMNDQAGLNICDAAGAAVLAGINNQARALYSLSIGGQQNISSGLGASIVGGGGSNFSLGTVTGIFNSSFSTGATTSTLGTIIGGSGNTVSANYATVLGGQGINANIANTAFAQNIAITTGRHYVQTGTSRSAGVATLVAGQVLVTNTLVTNSTLIMLSHQNTSGTLGHLYVSGITAGVSFSIGSSSGSDTSKVAWSLIEQF